LVFLGKFFAFLIKTNGYFGIILYIQILKQKSVFMISRSSKFGEKKIGIRETDKQIIGKKKSNLIPNVPTT
jgi:hypothetical protein